ncbi:MAG: hypothetical protein JWP37_4680, partial [Mucilaginibacter sp.]|nr:hypothetical protein [Mucilaginibacter sp.]
MRLLTLTYCKVATPLMMFVTGPPGTDCCPSQSKRWSELQETVWPAGMATQLGVAGLVVFVLYTLLVNGL